MAELRTEEEQLDALKNWWKENGRSLLIGIVLAVSVVLGWQGWQSYTERQATEASWLYQNMVEAVVTELDENANPQLETIIHLGNQLKENHSKSSYSQFAAMMLARVAVQTQDYSQALVELDWVLERTSEEDLKVVASLRKARVLIAMGELDQASSLLETLSPRSFAALYYELLGDIALQKGDSRSAAQAYDQALAAAENLPNQPVLQMKRDELGKEAG